MLALLPGLCTSSLEKSYSRVQNRPEYHSTGTFHDSNGRERIGRFYRKIIHTSDNRRVLFILFTDVTDLENAKREAEESADRFLLTLRSIGDGVIATDPEGVKGR